MASRKIIEVSELSASFGEKEILSDVSFEAREKDITVVLGGSGAGKSVLLKHMLGLYEGRKGSVHILGQNMMELDEKQQKQLYLQMGVFYQNGGLLNSLTVGENIALPLEQHTNLSDELIARIVWSKLQLVNLPGAYHLYPSQLSGGMLKRAALARAIVMDPPLLFCDEPGAGLDPISLSTLDELILNLRDQMGMSVVIITHEVSSILRIADRIVFIDAGKIIFQGQLKEALESNIKQVHSFFEKGRSLPPV
ncbi:MAG: ATP-binding cassette domain-containing protein [Bacteroidales bacterium]|nr:ATP-binding cassette domain-containing protein [Bacteroidales bacterium]